MSRSITQAHAIVVRLAAAAARNLRRALVLPAILWPAFAQAAPIVVVEGDAADPLFNQTGFLIGTGVSGTRQVLAASWSATGAYANVSITALLSGTFRFDAHLMRTIGPGTTIADQVATAALDVDAATPSDVALFAGLTLTPGDYFLVLDPALGSSGNWWLEHPRTITLDTGVGLGLNYRASNAGVDAAFTPASAFTDLFPSLTSRLGFAVAGDPAAISEPATAPLLLGALAAMALIASCRRSTNAGH